MTDRSVHLPVPRDEEHEHKVGETNYTEMIQNAMEKEFEKNNKKEKFRSLAQFFSSSSHYHIILGLLILSFLLANWYLKFSKKSQWIAMIVFSTMGIFPIFSKKKRNEQRAKDDLHMKKKILEMISCSQWGNQNIEFEKAILEMKKKFNVDSKSLKSEMLNMYKNYVMLFLSESKIKTEEIEEMVKIKKNLRLSGEEIGKCHMDIAVQLHKEYAVHSEKKESEFFLEKMNKFFFLSDRIFSTDSAKGYQYEINKLKKLFSLPNEYISNLRFTISSRLYSELIEKFSQENAKPETLEHIQNTIGIEQKQKEEIQEKTMKNFLKKSITEEKKITEKNKKYAQKLKTAFNIEEIVFSKILSEVTKPVAYAETMADISECVHLLNEQSIKKIAENILERKRNLSLASIEVIELLSETFKRVRDDTVDLILKDLRTQNEDSALKNIEKLFHLEKNLENILHQFRNPIEDVIPVHVPVHVPRSHPHKMGNMGNQNTDVGNGEPKGGEQGTNEELKINHQEKIQILESFLKKKINHQEKIQILESFLKNCIIEFSIESEKENKIEKLKKILSVSNEEYDVIYHNTIKPIFEEYLIDTIEQKNFSEKKFSQLKQIEFSLKLDKQHAFDIKMKIYEKYLQNSCSPRGNQNGSLASAEDKQKMNDIKKWLRLKWLDVQQIHDNQSEIFYKKAIFEAMGASGFISIEYWNSLEKLRKKLQMSEKSARMVFYQACEYKCQQIFDRVVVEHKKKIQLSNQKNTVENNKTENTLGIEVKDSAGNELFELVDFYTRNKLYMETESYSEKTTSKALIGLNGRLETKMHVDTKIDFLYPIQWTGSFDKKMISEIYRQYLMECFLSKAQTEKRKRFKNLEKLGPMIGIENQETKNIHSEVGSFVYKQILTQTLNKGIVDEAETSLLAAVQNILSMDPSKCVELIKQAKKNKIRNSIDEIFAKPKIDANQVAEVRKLATNLNIDLQKDLLLSNEESMKLFRSEINLNIEKGLLTKENQKLVEEIRSAFGLPKEITKKIILEIVAIKCEEYLINAIASLRKNTMEESIAELQKMVKLGQFLPIKMQTTFVSQKEKEELFLLFQSVSQKKEDDLLLSNMLNLQ